jgi:hypothetical protein
MSAAPKMTTKAHNIDPFATPNDVGAAPPAGGASAAPVGDKLAEAAATDDAEGIVELPLLVALANEALGVDEKLALGPIALFDTVLTSPLTVTRLLTTLASQLLASVTLVAPILKLLVLVDFGNVT